MSPSFRPLQILSGTDLQSSIKLCPYLFVALGFIPKLYLTSSFLNASMAISRNLREVIFLFKHSSQNVTYLAMFTHGTPTAYLKVGNGDILTRNIISAILVTMAGAEVDGFPSLTAGSQNASID